MLGLRWPTSGYNLLLERGGPNGLGTQANIALCRCGRRQMRSWWGEQREEGKALQTSPLQTCSHTTWSPALIAPLGNPDASFHHASPSLCLLITMIPSQLSFQHSSSQSSLYTPNQPFTSSQSLNFSDVVGSFDSRTFSQQSLAVDSSFTNADYNTPEMFKQNMHVALELLARVQALARDALAGM